MASFVFLPRRGQQSLIWKVTALLAISLYFGSAISESRRLRETAIARCSFRTGDATRDANLTPFYVPADDKPMYEEGIRDYLAQMGASNEQFSVVCVETREIEVKCELCLYNEVSEDRKHVRQGQVLDTMLLECIEGKFSQGFIMTNSQYHPICYPPPQRISRDAPEAERRSVNPHQQTSGTSTRNANAESCSTNDKGICSP